MTFEELNLADELQQALKDIGFKTPSPVQELAIPAILDNKDVIACAQTGTGKTAAYLLPIIHRNHLHPHAGIDTLILAPTRELAVQIDQQVDGFSFYTSVSSIAVYGGNDGSVWEQQKNALKQGSPIVIATPGRLIALLTSAQISFAELRHLVLDEADRMLEMGFYDDIVKIINYLPRQRQNILFSATMPPKIRQLADKILFRPVQINIAISKPAEGIDQRAYMAYDTQKLPLIKELLQGKENELPSIVIFCSTKQNVKILEKELKKLNFSVKGFHSDLEQAEREQIMNLFRNREIQILVATDILSRGIDIEGINLVVNYDVPHDAEDYIHRIGRTARASSTGIAITFINDKEVRKFNRIEQLIEKEIPKLPLPEFLGEGPAYDVKPKPKARPGNAPNNKKKRFFKKKNNNNSNKS